MRTALLLVVVLLGLSLKAGAQGAADRAWAGVQALEAGPGKPPADPAAAAAKARAHLLKQEAALSSFVRAHPTDVRRPQAVLQLAGVQAALGVALPDRRRLETAVRSLAGLEQDPKQPAAIKADAAFKRISITMQTSAEDPQMVRETILDAARNFAARYPNDRRAARLLTEASTLLENQPARKEALLRQALPLAKDEGTRQRIEDDLRRVRMAGQPLDLAFTTVDGRKFDTAALRGSVVLLAFWASDSPPAMLWLQNFLPRARSLLSSGVRIVTINLDRREAEMDAARRRLGLTWPVHFDGRGWDNTVARRLGINALPTLLVLDKSGRVASLNARDSWPVLIPRLLQDPGSPVNPP